MREMKWHILSTKQASIPLCWGTKCLEFDTKASAKRFLENLSFDIASEAIVKECIFYYDGGYMNATNLIYDPVLDSLREVKPI